MKLDWTHFTNNLNSILSKYSSILEFLQGNVVHY